VGIRLRNDAKGGNLNDTIVCIGFSILRQYMTRGKSLPPSPSLPSLS